ncbi:MAG: hypothetical protein Q9O62_03350 [Ardenticatenia bacterium]|nr:hypothetical protein [Ardenticatenia bacterium]
MRDEFAVEGRARLQQELIARIETLDEAQLRALATHLDTAPAAAPARTITRRRFLASLAGIGVLGAGVGTTAGLVQRDHSSVGRSQPPP